MNEYDIVDSDMIIDYASLLMIKNQDFHIGLMADNKRLSEYFLDKVITNLNIILKNPDEYRLLKNDGIVRLQNGSLFKCYSKYQNPEMIIGMKFNIFIDMFNSLPFKWRTSLIVKTATLFHVVDIYHPPVKFLTYS